MEAKQKTEVEKAKEVLQEDKKSSNIFLIEYRQLCKKHGKRIDIQSRMVIVNSGKG